MEEKMRDQNQVFQLLGETTASIFPLARQIMQPLFEEHFIEQRFYQPVFMAYQLLPDTLTEEIFLKRAPYNNPETIHETLRDAVIAGYLEEAGPGQYKPSQKGRDAIDLVHERFYDHINTANQFPVEKLKQLAGLLGGLVAAVGKADLAGGTLSFDLVHGGHPEVELGTLAEVDQLLDDLNAFRDDAHIAAWSPTEVSGQVWEALTFIWNGEASNAEELAEKLPYRSYTAEEYQKALDQLVELSWAEVGEGVYQISDTGKELREKVEEDTNAFYFDPWKVLSDEALDLLGGLLTELKETNLKLVE
jgi:hypothetical protein